MADQGLSIADIQRARNQKQVLESGLRQDTDKVAAELQAAHVEAERLKERLGDQDSVQQTQAFPHGTVTSDPQGATMSDKIQNAQADLYSNTANKTSGLGEAIKGNIASAEQATTTTLRDATAAAANKLNEAGTGVAQAAGEVADAAADMYNRAKETVQGALGMNGSGENGSSGPAAAYEGVVFGSDDPEYKSGRATEATPAVTGGSSGGVDHVHRVAVEVGDHLEVVSQELEAGQPATEQVMDKLGQKAVAAATAEAPAGSDVPVTDIGAGVFTPESVISVVSSAGQPILPSPVERRQSATSWLDKKSRTPALTSDELKSFSSSTDKSTNPQPTIATPKEPASLGEGSIGVSAGDPAGGANVMSAAKAAGRGLLEAVGLGSNASASIRGTAAPAGYVDDDPRTANVAVGDFKGLKEALENNPPPTSGSSTGASDIAPGVDTTSIKESASEAADTAKQGLSDAAARARESMDSAVQAAKDVTGMNSTTTTAAAGTDATGSSTGGGLFSGLAELVTGIATKVNLASNSEELLAGGIVPDDAAGPAAAAGPTSQPTPAAAAATGGDSSSMSDAAAAAKDKVMESAAAAKDQATDAAAAAKEKASDAAAAVKDKVTDTAAQVQEGVSDSMRIDDEGTTVSTPSHGLLQDAKEGFVGAYDAAANAAASASDKIKDTAASLTHSTQQQQQPSADQHPGSASAANRSSAGGGSGGVGGASGSAGGSDASLTGDNSSSSGGVMESLKQGWEDLKHGGAPAPRAVSHAGETSASHDVTSNVERSKHLEQDLEKKIYDAEVYHVSPGAQSKGSGSAGSHAAKSGAVAGANRSVTGTTPHDKPDSYGVGADQQTRFDGNKGIASGFGTGSAAPWSGDDSIKTTTEMFTASKYDTNTTSSSSSSSGLVNSDSTGLGAIMTPEQQQQMVDAAAKAGSAANIGHRTSSSSEAGIRSWVGSMSAVWKNIGRAAAVGPTGNKDVPKEWDNPTQNVQIDPVRGVTKIDSPTPGHKVAMRPADQVPTGGSADDPHLVKHKVERLGKVISDTFTTSSEEAAADPNNLKGKSSDNKPDGTEYFLKHEISEAGKSIAAAPERAAGALHTAGEIVGGVAGHIGHKIIHPFEKADKTPQPGASQAVGGDSGVSAEPISSVHVGAGAAGDAQDLQEQRMGVWAAGEDPAKKRDTLGDKVIGPLIGDATDPQHAKELADSYHKYKAEKEAGVLHPAGDHDAGSSGGPSGSNLEHKAQEAADRVKSGVSSAAHQASSAGHQAAQSVKGAAREATDTAKATGDVMKAEGEVAADSVKRTAAAAGDKAAELKDKAMDKAGELKDRAARTADEAADAVNRNAEEAKEAAGRAGEQAGAAAGHLLANVGGAAKALLGGLLGPFEKEGAFQEETAVVTGPPSDFEPVAAEQMTGREANRIEASRATAAGAGNTGTAGAARHAGGRAGHTAEAPAGADFERGVKEAQQGIKDMGQAGIDKAAHAAGTVVGKTHKLGEEMKARLQAGVDDTAYAAGLAAGHTEGAVENILEQVNAVKENVAEKVSEVTENIHVPPAEVPSNTEDIIRMKQQAASS